MASAFDNLAPRVVADLCHDFGLTPTQAAGIVGNLGAESGLRAVQEGKPTVAGSRGGFGWAQWTGPRRVAFEAWCRAQGFALDSYAANYGYLKHELAGEYAHTITQLRKTTTVKAAAETFEATYERAGIKRMEARISLANRALSLYLASPYSKPKEATVAVSPAPSVLTAAPLPWYKSKAVWGGLAAALSPLLARFIPGVATIDPNSMADGIIRAIDIGGPLIGGLLAVHGRVTATSPIAGTQAEQTTQAAVQTALDTVPPQAMQPEAWAQPQSFAVSVETQVAQMIGTMLGLPPSVRAAIPALVQMANVIKAATGEEQVEAAPTTGAPMPSKANGYP